ncbi:MAG: glutamate-5-semialdehyde dehydrogenase [Candidatus Omnitrophica bacterium]|nr:glutamate-5-semialdehyde dehydrogenase [Candidatus Omnitrophota bacterium]
MKYVKDLTKKARRASYKLSLLDSKTKTRVLSKMAKAILDNKKFILSENKKDVANASKANVAKSFIDRLTLNEKRLKEMSASLSEIANFADPVGSLIKKWKRPNGLSISKVRASIGVVMIVYEARPNVTSDCVGLLFKSSNVGILRGGKASLRSNLAIAKILKKVVYDCGINFDPFFIVEKTDHKIVDALLKENENIDMVIPRGGEALIQKVVKESTIPVIKHYKGICHVYVDATGCKRQAMRICVNGKCQRPSVCNAVETILVHQVQAKKFLPRLKKEFDSLGVEIRGCAKTAKILKGIKKATQKDWSTEYLALIVSVKIVEDINQAIEHINNYGSHHTETIITKNKAMAAKFAREVDSACCFVNISTRFSDGHQFGLGAEIGISTDKLHARGPMGVEDLTTYKYVVTGAGQIRE